MEYIKNYLKNNKIKSIVLLLMLVGLFCGWLLIKNDASLYTTPVAEIESITETEEYRNYEDIPIHIQQVTAVIRSHEFKGQTITFENDYTDSTLKGFPLKEGDSVFVTLDGNGEFRSLIGLKRDDQVFLMFAIFLLLLFWVASKQSLLIGLAALINLGIFLLIVKLQATLFHVFPMFLLGSVLFTVVTLGIVCGRNRKTLNAIITTICSVFIMILLALIVVHIFEDSLSYETVDFLNYVFDYKSIFYCSLLISGLGAIMDTSVIMATSISELIAKDPEITDKALRRSAREIAQDITGTIMNVLLFSCIVGALPNIILVVSNDMPLMFAFQYHGTVEIIRALVGSIGIILAVPVSYFVNIKLGRRKSV